MTYRTVEESGVFRKGKRVFFRDQCIFVAPTSNMENELMKDLFSWVKTVKGQYIRLLCQLFFIMNLCLYILLQTEMEEWPDYGIR